MRIILGITGASGVIIGYHTLKALSLLPEVETHLVATIGAKRTWELETSMPYSALESLADVCYDENGLAALISSGSFVTDGMIVAPCSMKTLAGIASGYAENLLLRAADVCLKECRKLVLVPREMPLNKVHIRNMQTAADMGCVLVPPMLTFYNRPGSVDDMINSVVGKVLMQFGLPHKDFVPWSGE